MMPGYCEHHHTTTLIKARDDAWVRWSDVVMV
jgi:hypothetical protein